MAQFWLTYQEMADIFGGTAAEARAGSIANNWSRLKDRSGVTHVRLPPSMVARYLDTVTTMVGRSGPIVLDDRAEADPWPALPANALNRPAVSPLGLASGA